MPPDIAATSQHSDLGPETNVIMHKMR